MIDRSRNGADLAGRVAVVTGATGGLGLEAAVLLARSGATVVLTGRDAAKGRRALDRLRRDAPQSAAHYEELDLARLASVRAFATRTVDGGGAVDILINNAGVMALEPRQTTADGFEMQFGTNYLGHFALTAWLWPALLRTRTEARVVNLASLAHRSGRIAFDDLQSERRYDAWSAYRQSKLAMLIFGLSCNAAPPRRRGGCAASRRIRAGPTRTSSPMVPAAARRRRRRGS